LSEELERELSLSYRGLDEVLHEADILTLHVPFAPETEGMIGAAAIRSMKPGAILINTARGGLVDESALCDALTSGHLLGAGLDAFAREPVRPSDPLCALPNVVLTPHYAGGTIDAFRQKMRAIFDNAARFQRGESLLNEVLL
jgi:D-3-phosphoglycerate dehydrogenase